MAETKFHHQGKRPKKGEQQQQGEAVYEIRNGVRYVKPYIHEYTTHAKGRWIHRNILDVLSKEFGAYPQSYWSKAIQNGNVLVNGNAVTEEYQFKNLILEKQRVQSFHTILTFCPLPF